MIKRVKETFGVFTIVVTLVSCAPFPDVPIEPIPDIAAKDTLAEESSEGGNTEVITSDKSVDNTSEADESEVNQVDKEESSESYPPIPDPEKLVINEVYYDAPGSDTDGVLFVELFGTESTGIGGYQLRFVNGNNGDITELIQMPDGTVMREDGFFVIADGRTGALDTTQVEDFDFIDNFDPQNGPDAVQLLDREGDLLDSVAYGEGSVALSTDGYPLGEGSAAIDAEGGHSIVRNPLGFDTDENSVDFIENTLPSPGSDEVSELLP